MLHFCQVKPPMTLNATCQFECCNRRNSKAELGRDKILNGICKDSPLSSQDLQHMHTAIQECHCGLLVHEQPGSCFSCSFFPCSAGGEKTSSPAVASYWAALSCGIWGCHTLVFYSLVLLLLPHKTAGYFCNLKETA